MYEPAAKPRALFHFRANKNKTVQSSRISCAPACRMAVVELFLPFLEHGEPSSPSWLMSLHSHSEQGLSLSLALSLSDSLSLFHAVGFP